MTSKIPFNVPLVLGSETAYVNDAINRKEFSGGGHYTKLCQSKLEEITGTKAALLTSSCTHALEMCAILLNIKEGDEVIMASYNFVSAANAFVLRGAKIVFVDIRKDTLNIDEELIEEAITDKTKAIVAMHYGGFACNMTKIMLLAEKHNLFVVEDAAHCIGAYSGQKHLGTMGHLGTLSFHSTKNIHCGEGGALLINDERFIERAQIIRDKGTNRQHFIEGKVQKYTWVDIGSSYLLGELSAAFLYAQTLSIQEVIMERTILLNKYQEYISQCSLFDKPLFGGNGHIFYLICQSSQIRNQIMEKLASSGISAYFHYVPLHLSSAGKKYSCTHASLKNTIETSDRLLRLPLYLGISPKQQQYVAGMLDIISK
jgi:dTDP-4-amino-4,6-dideoxygalactose transaminase